MSSLPPARGPGGVEKTEDDPPEVLDPEVARPIGQPDISIVRTILEASVFQGPLPPPDMLKAYDEASPGCANRLLNWTEKQGDHRREIELMNAKANVASDLRAQLIAGGLSFLVFLIGGVAVFEHQAITGSIIMGGNAVTIVGLFIAQQAQNRRARTPPRPSDRRDDEDDADDEPQDGD